MNGKKNCLGSPLKKEENSFENFVIIIGIIPFFFVVTRRTRFREREREREGTRESIIIIIIIIITIIASKSF